MSATTRRDRERRTPFGRRRGIARASAPPVVRGTRLGLGRATGRRARVGARERALSGSGVAVASSSPSEGCVGGRKAAAAGAPRPPAWGRTLHAHGVYRRQVYVSRLTNVVQQRRLALELLLSRNRRGDSLQLRGERRHGGRLARSESLEALSAVRSRGACLDPTPSRGRSVPATVVHRCEACRWNARLACGTASRRTDPHVATAPCPEFAERFSFHTATSVLNVSR